MPSIGSMQSRHPSVCVRIAGPLFVFLLTAPMPSLFAAETGTTTATQAGPEERQFRRRGKGLEPPERVIPPIEDRADPYLQPPFGPEDRKFFVREIRLE